MPLVPASLLLPRQQLRPFPFDLFSIRNVADIALDDRVAVFLIDIDPGTTPFKLETFRVDPLRMLAISERLQYVIRQCKDPAAMSTCLILRRFHV